MDGGSKERPPAASLLNEGFAVASINYRLSQHAVFPAQIEDCKAAIRWLRADAQQYGYNAQKIGVWGLTAHGRWPDANTGWDLVANTFCCVLAAVIISRSCGPGRTPAAVR